VKIPVLLFCCIFLFACAAKTVVKQSSEQKFLAAFLDVHSWHCEQSYKNPAELVAALQKDKRLKSSMEFQGVYEAILFETSFAVSVDDAGCTTDVLLKPSNQDRALFDFESLNALLLQRGYKAVGKVADKQETGPNALPINLRQAKYQLSSGENVYLTFPLDNQNSFYMTLLVQMSVEK